MSIDILVAYATKYGSTREVARAVADALTESGIEADVQPARQVHSLTEYRGIVLGAPLYMYRWHKEAHNFLKSHRKALETHPAAVFALGPVNDPHDEQEWQDSQAQLVKEMAKYPWFKPVEIQIFGGRFDPDKLRFPINLMAGSEPATDIRDWKVIETWGSSLARIFETGSI